MYTKFITNENWKALSANYIFDSDINLKNVYINSDANLNLNNIPFLKNLSDYCNNNYSFLFLTEKNYINNYLTLDQPVNNKKNIVGLIASNFLNDKVSEDTLFFSLSNSIGFKNIKEFNNSFFIEIFFYDNKNAIIFNTQNNKNNTIVLDPFDKQIKVINLNKSPETLQPYEIDKYSFNFIYDEIQKNIIIYKKINNDILVLYKTNNNSLSSIKVKLEDINNTSIFSIIDIKNVPLINIDTNFVSYVNTFNQNNLNINNFKSKLNIKNNFLGHIEYNNIKESANLNFLVLKNQLNINDNQNNTSDIDHSFRTYTTIHGGGNREEGYENLSLNYISDKITYNFKSDKNTWFRLPNNKNINKVNVNDILFFKNGAIAGQSPIYSDKIWKKIENDRELENTGTWLCSWLSGGPANAIWVDRFYDNSVFTAFEALKYNSNVNYTPQYQVLYEQGIKDYFSNLSIEPGGIYSYFHIGKNTAIDILKVNDDFLLKNKFDIFKTKNDSDLPTIINSNNNNYYNFNGNNYGKVLLNNIDFSNSNFTLSFFATRQNWVDSKYYNILGNYLDRGFSIINNNCINVISHYFIDKILYFLNDKFDNILKIDIKPAISKINNLEEIKIHSVFYRGLLDNLYIVTNNGILLEYTANGTLVDISYSVDLNSGIKIVSTSYSTNFGVLLDSTNRVFKINFKDNNVEIESERNITNIPGNYTFNLEEFSIVIDFADRIYRLKGKKPIFKNKNLYYIDNNNNTLRVFDTNTERDNAYIVTDNAIKAYSFTKEDETILLFHDSHEVYDYLGNFTKKVRIETHIENMSNENIGVLNFGNSEKIFLIGKFLNNIYFYDLNYKNVKKVNSLKEEQSILFNNNLAFDGFYQGILNSLFSLPGYTLRVKLTNIINREDYIEFYINILGETLDSGKHHFCMVLDSGEGFFDFYIDGNLYTRKTFTKNKYYFDKSILDNNIIVGATYFYDNLLYNNFYDSKDLFFVDDLTIDNFKLYSKSFNLDDIKLIFLTENNSKDLKVDITCGERNYLDTISRFFKNSLPGQKSNLINIKINDSLIKDSNLQNTYNKLIIDKMKEFLPAHVKINDIIWENSKDNLEEMLEDFFNTENTLTYS